MEESFLANLKAILLINRRRLVKAFLMVLVSNLLLIANPLVLREALMALDSSVAPAHPVMLALRWAVLLLLISFTSAYFKYWMRLEFMAISRDVEKNVRDKLFDRIQKQSRAFFDRHGIGELLSRLTNDITAYRDLLGPGIMYPLFFMTLVIPGVAALFTLSVPLTLLSLTPLLIIPFLHSVIREFVYQLAHAVQVSLGEISNTAQEHYSGIRIVKAYVIEKPCLNIVRTLCKALSRLSYKLNCLQGVLLPAFALLTRAVTLGLVILAGYIILLSWEQLNAADFISFMWIQSYIYFPLLMLGWVLPMYEKGRAAYARLVEIYREPIEVQDNPHSRLKIPPKANIVFKDLTFAYQGSNRTVLSHFNLDIKGGTFVGITGPVGAGKSTLFHLLNREYEIPHGKLFIGGHEIHEYPLKSFRAEMITVEQASFLFSRSVRENVRFGREEASQEELEEVARHADLHDTVMAFPERYDTVVGERGATLSGGQKQRVAMARAFLVDRSILLLDDIFSAVDSATEKRIFSAIKENFSGRTVLLITQRVSILNSMDRVIYMTHGKVVEDGAPKDLLDQNGHYAALAELQQLKDNS